MTSTTTVCTKCNNSFSGLEGEICARLAPSLAMFGALRGDRKPITGIVKHEGTTWRVAGGRMDELATPPRARGRVIPMPARREDQVRTIAAALLDLKLPAEAMLDGRFVLEQGEDIPPTPERQIEPVYHELSWGDRRSTRFMLKVAIEFLAFFDADAARGEETRAARLFARHDEGDEAHFRVSLDTETAGGRLQRVDALLFHGIEIWTSGGQLHYLMTLLTEMRWVGTLTSAWKRKPFRAAYTFDIKEPSGKCVDSDIGDGAVDGAVLVNKSRRVQSQELQDAINRLQETSFEHSKRRRIRATKPDLGDLYQEVLAAMAAMSRRARR